MAAAAAILSANATSWAIGGYAGVSGEVPRPPSPPGDGAAAERIIKTLESKKRDPAMARVIAEPLKQAKTALERAHAARKSGDAPHARMFDAVALEWAGAARDLERAATAEAAAAAAASQAREVGTKVERARTLLSETQARRGQAAAELDRLEAEAKDRSKSAAGAEQDRIDAVKRKAGKGGEVKPKAGQPKPKADDKPKPEAKPKAPPAGGGKKQAGVR